MTVSHQTRATLTSAAFSSLEVFEGATALCEALEKKTIGYRCPAHVVLISQESTDSDLFIILEGSVRVDLLALEGRQVTYQILHAGEFFGELSAIDGQQRLASVTTESPTLVARLPKPQFTELLAGHPEFVDLMLRRLVRLARWLGERVYEYHTLDVKGRVFSELMRVAKDSTVQAVVKISDRDMASRVGTTRENVTRIIGELRKAGVVERQSGALRLLQPERLQKLIEGCQFQ